MTASPKKRIVTCPQCGAKSEYSVDNVFRPFCSQRCRLIDLGQWATESYRIPEPIKPDDLLEEE